MVAVRVEGTVSVVTVKVAVVALAGTVTLASTWAAGLLLDKATTAPPAGAGPLRVTVPVEEKPPTTVFGFSASALNGGGVTVRPAVWVELL